MLTKNNTHTDLTNHPVLVVQCPPIRNSNLLPKRSPSRLLSLPGSPTVRRRLPSRRRLAFPNHLHRWCSTRPVASDRRHRRFRPQRRRDRHHPMATSTLRWETAHFRDPRERTQRPRKWYSVAVRDYRRLLDRLREDIPLARCPRAHHDRTRPKPCLSPSRSQSHILPTHKPK